MKVTVLAKPSTDYSRDVSMFVEGILRQSGYQLDVLNPDSPEGESFCRAYDIVEYPTVIAIDNDGRVQNMWRGMPLPLISEVSYYAGQP